MCVSLLALLPSLTSTVPLPAQADTEMATVIVTVTATEIIVGTAGMAHTMAPGTMTAMEVVGMMTTMTGSTAMVVVVVIATVTGMVETMTTLGTQTTVPAAGAPPEITTAGTGGEHIYIISPSVCCIINVLRF